MDVNRGKTFEPFRKKPIALRAAQRKNYSNVFYPMNKHSDCTTTTPSDADERGFGWMKADFFIYLKPSNICANPHLSEVGIGRLSSYRMENR